MIDNKYLSIKLYKNKIFNKGTLLNGVLIPKLLNIPIVCCSLINLDFLLLHIAQFDCIIDLFCLFLTIFGLIFLVYFLHTKQ